MDLLIAAVTMEQGASLWSFDKDFHRMERLGWVKLFHPPV
jgi:predicted nucleic acid-binding protein